MPDNLAGGARPTDYRAYRERMAEWCGRCGVEMNPVRAGMVDRPQAYRWSSASAHLAGRDDVLVKAAPFLDIVGDWQVFLSQAAADEMGRKLQHHERTGRPLADEHVLANLEALLDRPLKPRKPGRKHQ